MGENRGVPSTRTPSPQDDPTRRAVEEPDAVCAAAVDLARKAAEDIAEAGAVGEHLSATADGDRTVTHSFRSLAKGYRGWHWAVTVARAPRLRTATVSEVVLLPGPDAILSPAWVPWSARIAPGDLGANDALPYRADDPYLEPGYAQTGVQDEDELAVWELGLGRARVLSAEGRDAAATRWYLGDRGPTADEAVNAAASCAGCGFFLPIAGALRQVFGVCGNEWSPSDGRVVSVDHGCGAHSETDIERLEPQPLPEPILDEIGHETVVIDRRPVEAEVPEAELLPIGTVESAPEPDAEIEIGPVEIENPEVEIEDAEVENIEVEDNESEAGPEVIEVAEPVGTDSDLDR
jgi:Protein of unknown function (DUF3027)